MAVRYFNHVGYMITAPAETLTSAKTPGHVAVYLNRAGNFYASGMRGTSDSRSTDLQRCLVKHSSRGLPALVAAF